MKWTDEPTIWEPRWSNAKGTYYVVRADALQLSFPENHGFSAAGIRFVPLRLPRRFGAGLLGAGVYFTGKAEFFLKAANWMEAVILASDGVLQVASDLLSFAQRRPVRFCRLSLEDEQHVFRRVSPIGTISAVPREPRIPAEKIAIFLHESMTRLRSLDMPKHTLVMESVKWVNEGTCSAPTPEMRYSMLWMALETCLGVEESSRNLLLSADELKSLRTNVQKWAEEQCLDADRAAKLVKSIRNVNRASSYQRIMRFCNQHKIRVSEEEISAMLEARNTLQHEPWARPPNLLEIVTRLDEMVGRCILCQLGSDLAFQPS